MNEYINKLLEKLSKYKKELDSLRPLPQANLAKLKEYFDVELTYNSNAIEGNTLTLGETKLVILEGITIGGKSVKEHLEALNHKKAIDYLELIVLEKQEISEKLILELHRLILREIDDENAGKYRDKKVHISGSYYIPPDPQIVPLRMEEFIENLSKSQKHPVLIAADAHYQLVTIHPFIDGNGRCARLLMNLLLMKNGFPSAIIPMSRREEYIKSLEKAQTKGDIDSFYLLICECAEYSLIHYLNALK
jgi:Fic family protein